MTKSRSGLSRRVAAGVLASALAVVGIALAPPVGAVEDVEAGRLAGATRYGTAAAIAVGNEELEIDAFAGASTVILATGENFPDALAASGLAGANAPAPILLTPTSEVSNETNSALEELGIDNIIVVGGSAAVSPEVYDFYEDEGYNMSRVAGDDRYETAAEISGEFTPADLNGLTTAIIATGENYPDALAAGPLAYSGPYPVLLTNSAGIPSATEDALNDLGIEQVFIMGGTGVVSEATQDELEDITGNDAIRLAGTNRFGTAAEIGDYLIEELDFPSTTAIIASGVNFPDALAGGPLGGELGSPIVLVGQDSLPAEAEDFLDRWSSLIEQLAILGGPAAVGEIVVTESEEAAENVDNDEGATGISVTDAPELIDLEFVNLTSTGGTSDLGQLLVRAVFDEEILSTPIQQTGFKIYNAYGEVVSSTQAQRDDENTSAATVLFNVGDGPFALSEGTVFTVVFNTVQDADGKTNPEGDLPGFISHSFAAGTTRNPDLVSVAVQTANTVYDFTFDTALQVVNPNGFQMADTDGAVRTSTGASVVSGTDPANRVVRVTFAAPAGTATGARGIALGGAVALLSNAGGTNPTQAENVGGSTGSTDSPDLVSITVDDANDRVTFTFDENVDSPVVRTGFHVYYRQAGGNAQVSNSTQSTDRSATDPRSVIAQFPAGTINEFLAGAYVDDSAVDREGGTTKPNRVDEEGVASSFAAGDYLGPELTSVTVENVTDVFGNTTGRRARFLWDETITLTNASGFFIYDEEGNRTTLTGCALDASPNNNRVTCTLTGTTGTVFTELGEAVLGTVSATAVTGTTRRATANGALANLIANHEERGAVTNSTS